MQRMLPAAVLAFAAIATAPMAQAATFLVLAPAAPDGSVSGAFGNTGVDTLVFNDVFDFNLPGGGTTSITFGTVGVGQANLNFVAASLNGSPITLSPNGIFEFGLINDLPTAAGPQHLVISGTGNGGGSYGGSISFTPVLVPEPAAWALMITGFGGLGAMIRSRKVKAAMAA